jgi:DNA-binding NarL/FixJ family response regulator
MVADKLYLSFNTVNTHVKHIYEKLHVSSLGEAIAFYYKNLHP